MAHCGTGCQTGSVHHPDRGQGNDFWVKGGIAVTCDGIAARAISRQLLELRCQWHQLDHWASYWDSRAASTMNSWARVVGCFIGSLERMVAGELAILPLVSTSGAFRLISKGTPIAVAPLDLTTGYMAG